MQATREKIRDFDIESDDGLRMRRVGFDKRRAAFRIAGPAENGRRSGGNRQPRVTPRFSQITVTSGFSQMTVMSGFSQIAVSSGFNQITVTSGFSQITVVSGLSQITVVSGFSRTITDSCRNDRHEQTVSQAAHRDRL